MTLSLRNRLTMSSPRQRQRREPDARQRQQQRGAQRDEWLRKNRSLTNRGSNRHQTNRSQQPASQIFHSRPRRKQSPSVCFAEGPDRYEDFSDEPEGEQPRQSDEKPDVFVQKLKNVTESDVAAEQQQTCPGGAFNSAGEPEG